MHRTALTSIVHFPFRLMNPRFSDPNNHAPEVSPADDWDDLEHSTPGVPAEAVSILPPRRTAATRSPAATDDGQTGLRIDSNLTRAEPSEIPVRLEVQEINGSVIRLEQMEPAPLKVPRQVTFHERPVHEHRDGKSRGESASWGFAHRHPTLWILGAGVGVVSIVIAAMLLLPSINAPNAPRVDPEGPQSRVVIEEKVEGVEAMNQLLTKQPEAMQIFRAYATATYADDIVPLVRDGTALQETLRKHWKPLALPKQWAPVAESTWAVLELGGQACGLLQGNFPDQSKFSAYFTNDGDRLMLDWKATAAFGTATFGQLEKGRGDPAEIRGDISIADFYSTTWPEADYQSFRLIAPEGDIAIWCYARRGDPTNAKISQHFRKGEIIEEVLGSQKITLRLERGPAESLPNQWLIGEMLHIDWVSP